MKNFLNNFEFYLNLKKMLYTIIMLENIFAKKGGQEMEKHRLSEEEKDEILDMYESSSEMHTGAVMRIDLSNHKILYSSNFKRVTGIGKDEFPQNLEELKEFLEEEDFQKILDNSVNCDYESEWVLKASPKKKKEGYDTFELVGKKKRRGERDIVYILIRNPNQRYGNISPDVFFPKDLFDNSQQAIVITDRNNKVVTVNKAFIDIMGYSLEEVIGKDPSFWSSSMHDKTFYQRMWYDLKTKGFWNGRIINKKKNGEIFFIYSNIFEIKGYNGELVGYIAINSDITDNIRREEEIRRVHKYDFQTWLPKKEYLLEKIEEVVGNDLNQEELEYALIIVKINKMHELPVVYDFEETNVIIKEITERVTKVAGSHFFVARIAEDEFALFGSFDSLTNIEEISNDLIKTLTDPIQISNDQVFIKTRIGISIYPRNSKDPEKLINQARTALNVSSKNDINFYSPDLSNLIKYEKLIEEEIYQALQNNRLVLFLQPQIDTRNFEIIGAETLIRLLKSDGTILYPLEFLNIAKQKGLMIEIDKFVLENTAKISKQLNSSSDRNIKVFFNVSKSFFEDDEFLNHIKRVLNEYDLDPSFLGVELTEEIFIDDFYSAQKKINALKNMGLHIALDDFGTGFSSLSYLNKLRIDKIKIDKSFIDDLLISDSAKRLVSSIISMSQILGLEVIAEGVENKEQLLFLQSRGCYEIQGYYFSKPLSLDKFMESFC
ncbi:MAG TPA: EAL domain-containing protein [Defluviitoga sp.]|nr:EAL domain-containing protein [Defluviitoga sp.]HPZ29696.1 EAL domain-containing protein [Defluviitoga sp.]